MTFRRLLRVILPNLPRSSAFKRALNPVGADWTPTTYVLADMYDVLQGANWQRQNEGAKNPSKKPDPYPRPGDDEGKKSDEDRKMAVLLAQRERARARQAAEGGT